MVTGKQQFDSCKGQKLFLFHADSTTDYETIATPEQEAHRWLLSGTCFNNECLINP